MPPCTAGSRTLENVNVTWDISIAQADFGCFLCTGERFVAVSEDPALMEYMSKHDMLGETVVVGTNNRGRGEFSLEIQTGDAKL